MEKFQGKFMQPFEIYILGSACAVSDQYLQPVLSLEEVFDLAIAAAEEAKRNV